MSREPYDSTEAIADALFDRIAPLLERIAVALEKANEGTVLTVIEERASPGSEAHLPPLSEVELR